MFAYCLNNPLNMFDGSGYRPTLYGWYKNNIREPIKQAWNDLIDDVSTFDFFNTDINKVYKARFFSAYRGSIVIRHDISFLTSWGINGTIWLNHNLDQLTMIQKENTLNHEYGHICQEKKMGRIKYIAAVFIPSATYNVISRFDSTLEAHYYDMPWENDADRRGRVNRAEKAPWANLISDIYLKLWGE